MKATLVPGSIGTVDDPHAPPRTDTHRRGMTRRSFLRRSGIGGATVLVVGGGGLGYRAFDAGVFSTGTGEPYDAWENWRNRGGPLSTVAAAILAANAHDAQAWIFQVRDTEIDVFADHSRNLGTIDPFAREMYVSLGCALENLVVAAGGLGYAADVTLMPDPLLPAHAAHVALRAAPAVASELFAAIRDRHTNRGPYDGRVVPQHVLTTMSGLGAADLPSARVLWWADPPGRHRVGNVILAATEAIIADEQQSKDGFAWYRSSWHDIVRHSDGLTLDAQGLSDLVTAMAKVLPPSSRRDGDIFWRNQTRDVHIPTAAAFGVITVPDASNNADRLTGGRLLERMQLWVTAHGLAMQHMNQMTEREDREQILGIEPHFGAELASLVGDASRRALVSFRIGYPTHVGRKSPRRRLEDVTR
jgi:hypothetical protein